MLRVWGCVYVSPAGSWFCKVDLQTTPRPWATSTSWLVTRIVTEPLAPSESTDGISVFEAQRSVWRQKKSILRLFCCCQRGGEERRSLICSLQSSEATLAATCDRRRANIRISSCFSLFPSSLTYRQVYLKDIVDYSAIKIQSVIVWAYSGGLLFSNVE